MANFTITLEAYNNLPPTQIGNTVIEIENSQQYVFTVGDFTTNSVPQYEDPEGDSLLKIKILSIPTQVNSFLEYNGLPVNINDEILASDITLGLLIYVTDTTTQDAYNDSFTFDVADSGSNTFGGLEGNIILNVAEFINNPPTVVGDGAATIEYGQTLVFTRDMFTDLTQPPYSDPEGDLALQLQIASLPTDGNIKLNGVNVIVDQIIDFTDIDNGNLVYIPSLADTDGDIEGFEFLIADSGSGQFVG